MQTETTHPAKITKIRRLVLCLDGTWNNRDDSTNVTHHYTLTRQVKDEAQEFPKGTRVQATQIAFYNAGVGTGPLDRITGGGFGFGLEDHVREAYDWLVQTYDEGDGTPANPPDEIYIFGFSRGAYEARSLVGFIAECGLLRRGAPLTVTQLWENYCLLGRAREERDSFWRGFFGPAVPAFRRLSDLMVDPWSPKAAETPVPGGLPGQRVAFKNATEKLFVQWSRRVKITYLGVYDTVGAIGWDALAIPGLRSKLALHNNMRPTTIIQHCRHALASDENRSSFERTPFMAYIGEKTSEGEVERGGGAGAGIAPRAGFKMKTEKWQTIEQMWSGRIEQRWFVGAHSNIGGGYPDNQLAQHSQDWLLQGARDCGLLCETLKNKPLPTVPPEVKPRDSYAEFVPPLWELIIRAKRNYRVIDPPAEVRANRDEARKEGAVQAGFSLINIHEDLDDTVLDYWLAKDAPPPPPNLASYARRTHRHPPGHAEKLKLLAAKELRHDWLARGYVPQAALVLWATVAAMGIATTDQVFGVWAARPWSWLLGVFAAVFVLVDWLESYANFASAETTPQPWRKALHDAVYWTRLLGVVLLAFGLFGTLAHLFHIGWMAADPAAAWAASCSRVVYWWCVPASAALATMLLAALNKTKRYWTVLAAGATGLAALLVIPVVIHTAQLLAHLILTALGHPTAAAPGLPAPGARDAGLLLLLQLAVVYLLRASSWEAEPMSTANLGSITLLQKPWTPAGVKACLDRWCAMLGDHHSEADSECGMCRTARQSLWRDIFGYIPVYSAVLGYGIWYAAKVLGWDHAWHPLGWLLCGDCCSLPGWLAWAECWILPGWLWWALPLVTAVTDYVEDACHLHYLTLHAGGRQPSLAITIASRLCTQVKLFGVYIGLLIGGCALIAASARIVVHPELYGWRGLLALSISVAAALAISVLYLWKIGYKLWSKFRPAQ